VEIADRLFRNLSTPARLSEAEKGDLDAGAWAQVHDSGLALALVPESAGGFGLAVVEALEIVRIAGEHLLPLPLSETMCATWALGAFGLAIPEGALSIAPASGHGDLRLTRERGRWRISGIAHRVPWGRHANAIAASAISDEGLRIACVSAAKFSIEPGVNLAMEPRDTLSVDAFLDEDCVTGTVGGIDPLRAAGAVMRSLQMAGALGRICDMTIQFAQDRVQFGKSLSKFQVIQHNIAVLATQAAAAGSAASLGADSFNVDFRVEGVASAKARTGEAASIAAPIAHQIHGAMGFTYEHPLHFATRRLMAWREEFGSEREWQALLGARVRAGGADGAWAFLSSI
jgi:acyl-CoA dehydrogenase